MTTYLNAVSEQDPDRFLTVRDERGASINVERDFLVAGETHLWIARPGENDGHGVFLTPDDRLKLATFLLRGLS